MRKIKINRYEYQDVVGSRNVIKGRADNNHYYTSDVWSTYAQKLKGVIPDGFIVYGELIGWADEQTPIQKNYTYHLPPGDAELYVYRVAVVNPKGVLTDLAWEDVEHFCKSLGLKTVPVLDYGNIWTQYADDEFIEDFTEKWLDARLFDDVEPDALPLSGPKTVDEGVCVRIDGPTRILKAKSAKFLEHETKLLDADNEPDLESVG